MALIACPECGREVSTAAASCPNCGTPLRGSAPETVVAREGCFLQTLNIGCMGCGGIIALFILLAVLGGIFGGLFDNEPADPDLRVLDDSVAEAPQR